MKNTKKIIALVLLTLCVLYTLPLFAFAEEPLPCEHEFTSSVVSASCAEGGYTQYVCPKCGSNYISMPTPPLGHDYGAWEELAVATCTQEGKMRRMCNRCFSYDNKTIPVLPHNDADKDGFCDECGVEIIVEKTFSPFDWFVAFFRFLKEWFLGIFK